MGGGLRDLVLVGGGHAHALVLNAWTPMADTRVTLINPEPSAPYTGMLPGHVAGHYTRSEMMIDLAALVERKGARLVLDRAIGLDPRSRRILLAEGASLDYHVASIDTGITSGLQVPGATDHAVAAKPLGPFSDRWDHFVSNCPPEPRMVVIGGGTGGIELAMAAAFRLQEAGAHPRITVIERTSTPLSGLAAGTRKALLGCAARLGIRLLTRIEVSRIEPDAVLCTDGTRLESDFTLAVAGAQPQEWLARTGLDLEGGFLRVGPTLQTSDPAVFAAGDCAHLTHAPRPKAGVFAVREAPVLRSNLEAALKGGQLRQYHPQRDYLKLISCGGRVAVADKFGLRLEGAWLWRWKDRIDRKFMSQFRA
ncbi:FAD-dependent oxidoreductase [Rhodobacter sp. NSM]|uniref:FAD-dependent oxidoreductase n=1 Tax=Rhodobacter sp. NSM TaxID=3457501 RepID=UPI003FCF5737